MVCFMKIYDHIKIILPGSKFKIKIRQILSVSFIRPVQKMNFYNLKYSRSGTHFEAKTMPTVGNR